MRLEVQQARVAELLEQASHWRGRATAAESRVDATELALQRAQRLQTTAELDAREARKQAAAANDAAGLAQRTIADLEHRVRTHTHTQTHTSAFGSLGVQAHTDCPSLSLFSLSPSVSVCMP
jgi:IMP cyclohydrolase